MVVKRKDCQSDEVVGSTLSRRDCQVKFVQWDDHPCFKSFVQFFFYLTFVSVLFFFLRMKNINFVQNFNISTTANLLCITNIFCLISAEFLLDSVIPFCPPFFWLYSMFPVNRNSRRFTPHLANCFEVLKGTRIK